MGLSGATMDDSLESFRINGVGKGEDKGGDNGGDMKELFRGGELIEVVVVIFPSTEREKLMKERFRLGGSKGGDKTNSEDFLSDFEDLSSSLSLNLVIFSVLVLILGDDGELEEFLILPILLILILSRVLALSRFGKGGGKSVFELLLNLIPVGVDLPRLLGVVIEEEEVLSLVCEFCL